MNLTHPVARRRVFAYLVSTANLAVQLLLACLGGALVVADADATIVLLAWWSAVAALYLVVVALAITRIARPPRTQSVDVVTRVSVSWVAQFVGSISILVASFCGIVGAVEVGIDHGDRVTAVFVGIVGTVAMLLSWVMLNWGYAQFYYRRHHRSARPVIEFPATDCPRLSDFVYFAFTVGTSFATSDAQILSPAMRWAVTKHSVISFFYNGAIIVLAFNTLTAQK